MKQDQKFELIPDCFTIHDRELTTTLSVFHSKLEKRLLYSIQGTEAHMYKGTILATAKTQKLSLTLTEQFSLCLTNA